MSVQQVQQAAAALPPGANRLDGELKCPACKETCRSLHSEWRGLKFTNKVCPRCANATALVELRVRKLC